MRRKKQALVFAIIILLLGLGIGYAAIATTLTINGTTDFDRNVWNVYWDNVQVTTGSVTGTQVTQAPIITDQTVVSFQVNLKEPGEFYEFTVDAKNTGTLDAMIDTITRPNNLPEYAKLSFAYNDDRELYTKQYLKANTTEKIKVRVEYRTDIDPSSLPNTNTTVNLQVGATYVQADSTAQDRVLFYSHSGFSNESTVISTTPSNYRYIAVEYGEGTIKKRTLNFRPSNSFDFLVLTYGDPVNDNKQKLEAYCNQIAGTYHLDSTFTECEIDAEEVYVYDDGSMMYSFGERCRIDADGSVSCRGFLEEG